MAEKPTIEQVLAIRGDLQKFILPPKTFDDYTTRALGQLKRDLDDKRGILWSRIYTSGAYLDNTDSTGRNEDRCHHMIGLLAVAYAFEDYALQGAAGSQWWDLYLAYRADYDELLKTAKLDVDADDSGSISSGEENVTGQRFLSK